MTILIIKLLDFFLSSGLLRKLFSLSHYITPVIAWIHNIPFNLNNIESDSKKVRI